MDSITISIFAYNEETTIGRLVDESLSVLKALTSDYEVLVVNDGSTDRTRDIVRQLAEKDAHVRLLDHPRNLGFGPTLRDAYQQASKTLVFLLPGDGQIAPGEIHALLPALTDVDLVLGWR